MPAAPLPADEAARLAALRDYAILDTPPEQAYDDIVNLAACLGRAPMALVTLVDTDRQWFKANRGMACCETPRDAAFCAHALATPEQLLVVPDATRDPRFADNPLVTGAPGIRFYAGAPLVTPAGHALGTLCVIDTAPRDGLDAQTQEALVTLARSVMTQLELRRVSRDLAAVNAHLVQLSFVDGLTAVANRRALDARLEEEVARSRRHEAPLALLLLDIDHFKGFNDRFGHLEGDMLLREFAQLLRLDLRQTDLVARYGGEEFAALLPETTLEGASLLAERYRARIEAARFGTAGHAVTASIGVAVWLPRHESASALLADADAALYAAKRGGRNRVMAAP